MAIAAWAITLASAFGQAKYEPYAVSTMVGIAGRAGAFDGRADAPWFAGTYGVAVDAGGTVYVADRNHHTIRKITRDGAVQTLAGLHAVSGSADGTGSAARFFYPEGVAVDSSGNVYVADTSNYTIRKITPDGVVVTLAGSPRVWGTADGVGSAARFNAPYGVAVDGHGNVYVADTYNHTIRRITPAGVVTTVAGLAQNWGSADGVGSAARFYNPEAVAVDGAGTVYVADGYNYTVRKITSDGAVSTLAGLALNMGTADGTGSQARFFQPGGIAADAQGNVYVADTRNNTVRQINSAGDVRTIAGAAGHRGTQDGLGNAARFDWPRGIAVDSGGYLYVGDSFNSTVRKVAPDALVSTLAGHAGYFNRPADVALDAVGNLYVADAENSTIRKIAPDGVVSTIAGRAGVTGKNDGFGGDARFYQPRGVAVDASDNLYVADYYNACIRKITPERVVTTFAGYQYQSGNLDGRGTNARFRTPAGAAVDAAGNVYVADQGNHNVRKIAPDGLVSTLAGPTIENPREGTADGTGSEARFNSPAGLAIDGAGTVYVADTYNHTIRKISSAGVVSTLAGLAGTFDSRDGAGTTARFSYPTGIDVDQAGNIYVTEAMSNTIRKIKPDGTVTTLAGRAREQGTADARGSLARFSSPQGIAVSSSGKLFIVDSWNHTIRAAVPAPPEILSIVRTGPNAIRLQCFGVPDAINRIEYSRDLTAGSFQTLASIPVDDTGNFQIDDRDAGSRKFYRLVHP